MPEKIEVSEEVITLIKKYYEDEGLGTRAIGKLLGYSRDVVYRIIAENSFKKGEKPKKVYVIDEKELEELYIKQRKSVVYISKLLCIPKRVILKKLHELNFPVDRVKNRREKREKKKKHTYKGTYKLEQVTYEELYDKIIVKKMLRADVAKIYNVSVATLGIKLREFGISIHKHNQEDITKEMLENMFFDKDMTQPEIAKELGIGRTKVIELFKKFNISRKEIISDRISKEQLIELYVNQNKPVCEIAKELNESSNAVLRLIRSYNLKALKTEEENRICYNKSREIALSHMRSAGEKELSELFPTPYTNIHRVINLELDLFYQDQMVAIEYNGDYWHSMLFPRYSGLHIGKRSMCKNNGIQLINIFERDWQSEKTKVKLINHISRILYLEKYQVPTGIIKRVFKLERREFEHYYNLEDTKECQHCVGVFNEGILLSSLSYDIIDNKCYIVRYTTHKDYREDYTELLQHIKDKHNLPIVIQYDKRYYCSKRLINTELFEFKEDIDPRPYYVLNRKAKRKEDASGEYLSNPRCYPVLDCGYAIWEWK